MGKFAKNFIISLLAYCIFIFLWLLLIVTLKDMVFGPLVIGRTPPPPPIWLQVIWWSEVPIFMSIYFYLGTKLNQLGNHLLNFLSVSWSLVFGLSMMAIGSYMLILPQLSFGAFTMFISEHTNNLYLAISITSILPALITWLGMVYKSKRA